MPDISMCENNICPSKDKCYRFKATPSYIQSYQDFKPENKRKKKCNFFIKIFKK